MARPRTQDLTLRGWRPSQWVSRAGAVLVVAKGSRVLATGMYQSNVDQPVPAATLPDSRCHSAKNYRNVFPPVRCEQGVQGPAWLAGRL